MKKALQGWGERFVAGLLLSLSVQGYCACPSPRKPDKPFGSRGVGRFYDIKPNPIGTSAPDKIKRSRIFGIAYHSRGMEYSSECQSNLRAEALDHYLRYKKLYENASDQSLAEFRAHSEVVVYQPRAISDIVDRCFAKISQQWLHCGGQYSKTARYMSGIRKELNVQIMPTAFMVSNSTGGPKIWAAGMASVDLRNIFAATSTLSPSPTGTHYIRSLESIVCWELGNNFAMNHGKYARSLAQEVGFQVPCQFYKE